VKNGKMDGIRKEWNEYKYKYDWEPGSWIPTQGTDSLACTPSTFFNLTLTATYSPYVLMSNVIAHILRTL